MSVEEKWIWNPETPASVPAGARISAGKSGSVLMSLPTSADVSVNCVPASCMPSPESPAKRIVTEGKRVTGFGGACPLPLEEVGGGGCVGAAVVSKLMSDVASSADLKSQIETSDGFRPLLSPVGSDPG